MSRKGLVALAVATLLTALVVAVGGVATGQQNETGQNATVGDAIDRTSEVQSLLAKQNKQLLQIASGGLTGLGLGLVIGAGVTYGMWQRRIV